MSAAGNCARFNRRAKEFGLTTRTYREMDPTRHRDEHRLISKRKYAHLPAHHHPMSIRVKHPNGEEHSYSELPSLSALMLARDDPTKDIVFVDGNPRIVEKAPTSSPQVAQKAKNGPKSGQK
jgi:hypothetical protein